MKKLVLFFLLISVSFIKANPMFTISSIYYYTIFAYPHDILKWPKKGIFFYTYPQTLPWQGNVTNINERPNDTYISNYNDLEFPAPGDYQGDPSSIRSYMKVSSYAYNNRYSLGGIYNLDSWGKFYFEFGTNRIDLELNSEGVVRGGEDGAYQLVPFNAGTTSQRRFYDFQLIYANYIFNNPFGLKIQYQSKKSFEPMSFLNFTRDGTTYQSKHLTWGWTTVACSHIFGVPQQNADAWFLNDYTIYDGGQLDLQLSYEHNGNHKSGIRYRTRTERGKHYSWNGDNITGNYTTDSRYEDEIKDNLIRAYSKIRFWKFGDLDLGFLFFAQYGSYKENTVSTNRQLESEALSTDAKTEYTIETNPWLNFKFDKGTFDMGILFELSYTSMKNTAPRWNGALGITQKDVVRNSYAYNDWSPSWESFSQGSYLFLATGAEAIADINIYGRLSAIASLTLLRKYSFITKEYGDSEIPQGSSEYVFNKSHTRNDYKNETWMTGSIGIAYGWGPLQTIVSMQLPLAYLVEKNTELENTSTKLLDKTQRNVWAVQEPISFRLLFIFGLER
jgi:hypothetical protein